jgi:heme-degrading monooxygenase HmoA
MVMTEWHLAQLNNGRLRQPIDHPDSAGFADGLDHINALAEAAPGFVWRLQDETGNATHIETPDDDPAHIVNISVWESVEALRDFTYAGNHVGYMRERLEWFEPRDGPHLVLWWIETGHEPTVEEGYDRLTHLIENGPTREAFTFMLTFPPPP